MEYDANMVIKEYVDEEPVLFYDIDNDPIRVYGVWREGEHYVRMPKAVAETVSEGIANRYSSTAGGRIRFVTDSPFVVIKAVYSWTHKVDINTFLLSCGFDTYVDGKFNSAVKVPLDIDAGEHNYKVPIYGAGEHLVTINMPTHSAFNKISIGIAEGTKISHAPDYTYEKPILYYGSSITHGSSASRPGMTYTAQVSRLLDSNYHSLGFGGLCKGEPQMADYIASLDMSVFVLDYDHNAPTSEHLLATHESVFLTFREKHPDIPVVMISRPTDSCGREEAKRRFDIIKRTYDNARSRGDKNVYLINGLDFFGEDAVEFTVDTRHPTDLGFYVMARTIADVIRPLLK